MARLESLRTLVASSVQKSMQLHQVDITTAFLNGVLEEEVYMYQPQEFVAKGQENLVCKLKRSLYGLKQSPRCWNSTLDEFLKQLGFVQSTSDPCIYVASDGELMVGVYVDDIVIGGESEKQTKEFKLALGEKFDVKDLGRLHYFLGMKIAEDAISGDVWMGQPAYIEKVLNKFGMKDGKSVATPVDASTRVIKAEGGEEEVDQSLYQSAVIHGYSDSDWAGDLNDRKSMSGYIFMLSGAGISWRSKKQTSVALSTAEAEYIALSSSVQEAIWLKQLTSELSREHSSSKATVIYEDNQSAISLAKNPQFHGKAKHIDIRHHFVHDQVTSGTIELKYCCTENMVADIFTKGLCRTNFEKLRKMAGVVPVPTHFTHK